MEETYGMQKPKFLIPLEKAKDFSIKISTEITQEEFDQFEPLLQEAKRTIKVDLTTFHVDTFTKPSPEKAKMNFKITRAFCEDKLVGYALGYCQQHELEWFYLDTVFVLPEYHNKGIGLHLAVETLNSVIGVESITSFKFITQENNQGAKKLLDKIAKSVKE